MPKFQKKPVVIDAVRWDGKMETANEFIGPRYGVHWSYAEAGTHDLIIPTLEGPMRATLGDWIIKGIKGEFYPCKPDIFEATYSPVAEVPVSNIPPHQQRVIDEKCQLDTRLQALRKFIGGNVLFEDLHENEQQRLRHQVDAMAQYSSILAERIENFPVV